MKILFVGDASATHYNLSKGLQELGHQTMLVGHKTGWRNFPQDVKLERGKGRIGAVRYGLDILRLLPRMRGFDIVQFVGPHFMELKKDKLWKIYDYLRKHNRHVVLDAIGEDYLWTKACCEEHAFRYDDFFLGNVDRRPLFPHAQWLYEEWTHPLHKALNLHMAQTADAIVPVLYEYWRSYLPDFGEKCCFIPLPVLIPEEKTVTSGPVGEKVRLFIGIQRERSAYKGTDIMLQAAQDIVRDYPHLATLTVVENLPYAEYLKAMEGHDAILDQLYSYTPAMNALIAMSKGIVNIGGGEPENYEILGEKELKPIINVLPSYQDVYEKVRELVLHRERIPELKRQSIQYIRKHHDYRIVAKRYEQLYQNILSKTRETT